MRIYLPLSAEGFELCHPQQEEDFETINSEVNGEPRHGSWQPIPMSLIRKDRGKKLKPSDAPWLASYALVLRRAAADALASEFLRSGEYLPLSCPEAELVVLNPWKVDALDENASSVQRYSDGGIIRIARHAFVADRLEGVSAFKLPNLRVSPTFVGERVVALWNQSRLRGLVFKQVWDSGQP